MRLIRRMKISMATRVAVQGIGEVSWWGRVKKRKKRKPSMMGRVIIIRGSVVIALSANEQRNREHSNATPCPTLQLTLITLPIIFLKLANWTAYLLIQMTWSFINRCIAVHVFTHGFMHWDGQAVDTTPTTYHLYEQCLLRMKKKSHIFCCSNKGCR